MNDTPKQPRRPEFDRLLAHACDGLLTPAEKAELSALLASDAEARRAYLEAMSLEGLLHNEHAESLLSVTRMQQLGMTDYPAPSPGTTATRRETSQFLMTALRPRRPRTLVSLLGLAAGLLVAVAGLHLHSWWRHSSTVFTAQRATFAIGQPVGRITNASAVRWDGGSPPSTDTLVGGQLLKIRAGIARLQLDQGVVLSVEGPAELEIVSNSLMVARRGAIRALAGASAEGFVIQTPITQVVQVGPDRGASDQGDANSRAASRDAGVGVQIGEDGATDVVVFDGEVALQYAKSGVHNSALPVDEDLSFRTLRSQRTLCMGQAVSVGRTGEVSRIVSIDAAAYPLGIEESLETGDATIRGVFDNQRPASCRNYYRVVAGGLGEDARAFVDRFHQWNGLDAAGLPPALRGADYLMTFNADKWATDYQMQVNLTRAATVYVFVDNRAAPPAWLEQRFEDTGWDIGLDEGWRSADGRQYTLSRLGQLVEAPFAASPISGADDDQLHESPNVTGAGPGKSIDAAYSVWRLETSAPTQVTLGPPGQANEHTSMYGVAAAPR